MGKDTIECLQDNLKRFKEYMTKIDAANRDLDLEYNLDTPAEFEKIKCVKNMKSLLSNNYILLNINFSKKIINTLLRLKTD